MSQPVILQKQPRLPASAGRGAVRVKAANSTTMVDTTRAHPGGRLLPNLCLRDPMTSGRTCVIQASASAASQRNTQTRWAARQDRTEHQTAWVQITAPLLMDSEETGFFPTLRSINHSFRVHSPQPREGWLLFTLTDLYHSMIQVGSEQAICILANILTCVPFFTIFTTYLMEILQLLIIISLLIIIWNSEQTLATITKLLPEKKSKVTRTCHKIAIHSFSLQVGGVNQTVKLLVKYLKN